MITPRIVSHSIVKVNDDTLDSIWRAMSDRSVNLMRHIEKLFNGEKFYLIIITYEDLTHGWTFSAENDPLDSMLQLYSFDAEKAETEIVPMLLKSLSRTTK